MKRLLFLPYCIKHKCRNPFCSQYSLCCLYNPQNWHQTSTPFPRPARATQALLAGQIPTCTTLREGETPCSSTISSIHGVQVAELGFHLGIQLMPFSAWGGRALLEAYCRHSFLGALRKLRVLSANTFTADHIWPLSNGPWAAEHLHITSDSPKRNYW